MSDAKLTVNAIAELQAENDRLKRLSRGWLEEKKTLNGKLEKIEQIVNKQTSSYPKLKKIRKILEQE